MACVLALVGLTLPLVVALGPTAAAQVEPADVARPAPPPARALHVTALANEGALLRAGDVAVLIDAFLAEPYSVYGALPEQTLEALLAAAPPFDGVDLALVSHRHGDHLQPAPAARFLRASPGTWLASSPQVLELVREADAALAPAMAERAADATDGARPTDAAPWPDEAAGRPTPQPRAVLPEPGQSVRLRRDGLSVDVLRLSHGTGRFAAIQNLGHVIELGGQRVLHVGDAAMDPRRFAPYALAERDLDVALLPFWYFLDEGGRQLVREHLRARHVIACHIPPADLADVRAALAESDPHVLVPDPLQVFVFEPPAADGDDGG